MPALPMPKQLRIGYQDYVVASSKKTDAWLIEQELAGRSNGNLGRIEVRSDYTLRNRQETLLHEVLHQVLFCAGNLFSDEIEEPIVRALGMGLLQVVRDNPDLVRYLTQE